MKVREQAYSSTKGGIGIRKSRQGGLDKMVQTKYAGYPSSNLAYFLGAVWLGN